MKRAILILATALLGATGCHSRHCQTDITFFWHFPSPSGGAELGCGQAGVVNVEIVEDGFSDGSFPCAVADQTGVPVQGITLTNFAVRNYQFELRGLDAGGNVVSQAAFSFTPNACADNQLDEDLTSPLSIDFQFTDIGFTCFSAGTFMWYELLDFNNQVVDIVGPDNTPAALPCTSGPIVLSNLAVGPYTVSRIQEVEPVGGNFANGFVVRHAICTGQSFQHLVANDIATVVVPPVPPGSIVNCFP